MLVRCCKALDLSPRQLAAALGHPYSDVEPLLSPHAALADVDRSPVLWAVLELIDRRTALLLAARQELNVNLDRDRARRAVRVSEYSRRGTPDSLREIRG